MSYEGVNIVAYHILAEDKKKIFYRPGLKKLTGCIHSAILLNQIIYWWHIHKEEPFYKFAAPCEHPLYRTEDSWQEELCFTRTELETGLRYIATKVKPGDDKSDLRNVYQDGEIAPITHLVLYWRDRNNVTWYELNLPLLFAHLEIIYGKDEPVTFADVESLHSSDVESLHSGKQKANIPLFTESTSENTTEKTTIRALLLYEENFGLLTSTISSHILSDVDDYGDEWVSDAMNEAILQGKRSLKYVRGILSRWKTDGRDAPKPKSVQPVQLVETNREEPQYVSTLTPEQINALRPKPQLRSKPL